MPKNNHTKQTTMNANFLRLYQPSDAYAYNSDSLLLVDFAKMFLAPHTLPHFHPRFQPRKSNANPINLIDIGAGCGIIGLLCAKHFGTHSHLIEINKSMATLAYINATTNNDFLESNTIKSNAQKEQQFTQTQISQNQTFLPKNASKCPLARVHNIDFLDSSLPQILSQALRQNLSPKAKSNNEKSLQNPTKAHFCISNPPFYPDSALRSHNPHLCQARYASSMPLEKWIPQAKKVLLPRGGLIFCYHPSDLPRVFTVLKNNSFTPEVLRLVYPLQERESSLALIYARLDSNSTLKIYPPLFTHNSNGNNHAQQNNFSPEVANIYATYRTHSIKVGIDSIDTDWLHC